MSWPILAAILENSDLGADFMTRLLLVYEEESRRRDSAGDLDILEDIAETAAWNSDVLSIAILLRLSNWKLFEFVPLAGVSQKKGTAAEQRCPKWLFSRETSGWECCQLESCRF